MKYWHSFQKILNNIANISAPQNFTHFV